MAIVQTFEIAEGRSVSGTARESFQYQRSFAIKIDDPATPMDEIAQAPGILLGSPHPDDPSVFATSFDCSVSDDLLLYTLNVTYQAPPLIDASSDGPGSGGGGGSGGGYDLAVVPADTWSGSSSVAAVPIKVDRSGIPIKNTAGTPIPDVQADWAFASLSLTRSYATAVEAATALATYTNKVNSAPWAGTDRWTWKCQGGSWQKQTQSSGGVNLTYYSATFNFAYTDQPIPGGDKGWQIVQVMIGTRDKDGKNITEADVSDTGDSSVLVSEPVGLDVNGVPVKPPAEPYQKPFLVYNEIDFNPIFGTPS